jgi:hypothetical protein
MEEVKRWSNSLFIPASMEEREEGSRGMERSKMVSEAAEITEEEEGYWVPDALKLPDILAPNMLLDRRET